MTQPLALFPILIGLAVLFAAGCAVLLIAATFSGKEFRDDSPPRDF